ncbi:YbgC/FadM family acyl-CoA thioesterase [Breznakiella homolactica]|uniref:YbgC/FadM family acyl-CoA thioesterase n=1 Tax=Breznakiella homolactica TaxID=2798577 RepID=A0A7T8BCT5_9SPIR|nr:YbgC/FadM family acyl-CoA thioesterase [Breznakiella homolactica]QQO11450.1 YbgC/FadM family acyl-CoA thioesterase [Breznakiella homolactica]
MRVYFSDTDAGGVVYHSRYLDMAEHARTEWLHLLGIDHRKFLQNEGTVFVVRSVKIDFNAPAFLDEALLVRSRLKKAGRFAIEVFQEVLREEQVLVALDLKLGYISVRDGRPVSMPEEWRRIFNSMETVRSNP